MQTEEFRKVYVSVNVNIDPYGNIRPMSITFENGKTYPVDRLIACVRAAARKVGGTGIRYTVRISGKETFLFEDEGRWFVEAKVYPGAAT